MSLSFLLHAEPLKCTKRLPDSLPSRVTLITCAGKGSIGEEATRNSCCNCHFGQVARAVQLHGKSCGPTIAIQAGFLSSKTVKWIWLLQPVAVQLQLKPLSEYTVSHHFYGGSVRIQKQRAQKQNISPCYDSDLGCCIVFVWGSKWWHQSTLDLYGHVEGCVFYFIFSFVMVALWI